MDSHQLELFRCLGRELSFKRVAQRMELTPSAVSHALKSLEQDLGCRLLERNARRVTLTEAGRQLMVDAEHILGLIRDARHRLVARAIKPVDVLRIALQPEHASRILPAVIREFRESFPTQRFELIQASLDEVSRMVTECELQMAFVPEPISGQFAHFSAISEEEFRYVTHPLHPWALQRSAMLDPVGPQRFIVSNHDSHAMDLLEKYQKMEGVEWLPWMEVPGYEAVKECVSMDLGVGVLPSWYIGEELREKWLHSFPFGRRKLRRRWGLLTPHEGKMTLQENTFATLFRKAVASSWSRIPSDQSQRHAG